MRKTRSSIILFMLILIIPVIADINPSTVTPITNTSNPFYDHSIIADVGNDGVDTNLVLSMTRFINGQSMSILNSYNNALHQEQLDLSSYQIPGWTLFSIEINASDINATAERKTFNINPNDAIKIENNTGLITDALYQEFYNQPHDGKLENYSLTYRSPEYEATLGHAYLVVRSNFSDKQTNVTGWVTPFSQTAFYQVITHDCSPDGAIMNASTFYYVVIDGTNMIGQYLPFPVDEWVFNSIWWEARYPYAGLQTGYHLRDVAPPNDWDVYDAGQIREAELNYTYTPWNKTENAPLTYATAEQIALTGNGTSLSGTSWSFTSNDDMALINFQSNQSITIDYNITLQYKKESTASTIWNVINSGDQVYWNVSMILDFPVASGTTTYFANVSIPSDWTPIGLYNSTSIDYGHFTKIGSLVYCTDLTNGTWILTNTADNYVTAIDLSDSSTGIPILDKVSILTDVDIDVSVEDGIGTPQESGMTNLTIWYGGVVTYTPANVSVSGGLTNYLWNIDSIADYNGTYSIEVFWSNGLEAGYLVTEVFVFYSTTLVADDYSISAYADTSSAFSIGVDFDCIFPFLGIDDSLSDVTYSFGAIINATMDDQGNGRWTKDIDTTGMSSCIHLLYIYAEGYALENQSLIIAIDLTYETKPINWTWLQGNDISYLESTNLTVSYVDVNDIRIPGAWVNVTFESHTYNLTWDGIAEVYWIELHGENFTGVPGIISLNVSAWKIGYAPQYNDTLTISVSSETGVVFSVDWNPTDRNITYIEQITITVTYNFNSVPISDAWVRVTFVGYPLVNMTYNPLSEQWEVTLDGSDYLGTTTLTVRASRDGYDQGQETQTLYVTEDIPSLENSWTSSAATTDYATDAPLAMTVRDSIGTIISDAILYITVNGIETVYAVGEYSVNIAPPQTAGIYQVNVTMVRYGYETTTVFLTLSVRATTTISIDALDQEYEQWNLTVTVTYSDSLYSTPITGANVVMTLDGVDYTLAYSAGVYSIEILLDLTPGTYTVAIAASAPLANSASDTFSLLVQGKRSVNLELTSEGDPSIEGQIVSLIATLRYNDTGTPVVGQDIYFVVRITFVNGTQLVRDDSSQYDSTNTNGIATWNFEIPSGSIESIQAEAYYHGSRLLWSAEKAITVGAGTNPLLILFNFFFMDNIGRLILISFVVLGIVAATYNRKIKPKKRAARSSLDNQLQMFVDLESLRHFMAVYLDRGTCVFYHPFTDERIQPDLISGFIAAITSVYGEIKGDGVRGTLEEIQYHGLRLNSYSGDKIIGILILEGEMTPLLKDRLQFFVELFENQYERDLDGWTGLIDCFDPEWVVSTLNSAFNYSWLLPHRFGPTQKVSKTEARILDYIAAVRDERGEFFIRNLLTPLSEMLEESEAKILDRLLALQDKGAIVPVGVQTVLQRQGMGLSNGEPTEIMEGPSTEESEEDMEPVPEDEITEEEPEDIEEEKEEEPTHDKDVDIEPPPSESEKEIDPMEAFVKDVESLLTAKKDEEPKKDNTTEE
ncbi:MAG: hypothetical protein JW779_06725 [Candidatus Thorarchaeota archaeon]|nr:hypothetical protein [Candidatus Thorarchaeota archaeon]